MTPCQSLPTKRTILNTGKSANNTATAHNASTVRCFLIQIIVFSLPCRNEIKPVGGKKRIQNPPQVRWQPSHDAEAALALLALKPMRRHLVYAPPPAVSFDQQFDTVTETFGRLNRDFCDDPAGKEAEAVRGVARGHPRKVVQRPVANPYEQCF